ncbi:MAG TPA: TrkH family potassium uptake protein [Dongiaceae bacterium]|nr:TrkH family potassium uptake protein [Dongiaceae bacterium]
MSWPDHRSVFYAMGTFLSGIAALMLLPALADYLGGDRNWAAFVEAATVTGGVGGATILAFRTSRTPVIGRREGFLLITLTWVVACLFAALPFMLSSEALDFADAFFESTSGLTTTGSTIIANLDAESHGILLWRALLHWVGGIGIIVLAVMLLPYLRVGGMQLFRAESSDQSDKIRARANEVTWEIFSIYAVLTLLCAVALTIAGMPLFDSVCHAMSVIATGGFANKDSSIGFYRSAPIEWVTTLFTLIGGMTFALMARAVWHGDWRGIARDTQTRWYFGYMMIGTLLVMLWQVAMNGRPFESALRSSAFAVVSLGTTTGLVSEDYSQWGPFPEALFIVLLFVGGCTGSTTGAIKVFRFCILGSFAKWQMRSLIHQHRVLLPTYNGVPVTDDVIRSVIGFVVLYLFAFAVLGTAVAAFDVDMTTAFSGVAQALGNVGPGFGTTIGPAGNFSSLPEGAKWLLSAAMLLGRLELLAVLVLFTPTFWRG